MPAPARSWTPAFAGVTERMGEISLCSLFCPQRFPVELADHRLGEVQPHLDHLHPLMLAELGVAPDGEGLAADVETLLERPEIFWPLAAIGVGYAEHARILDRGMLVELHLAHAPIDLAPAHRLHFLLP